MTSIVKAELGSWEWLCETGGSLTARQRFELLPGLLTNPSDHGGRLPVTPLVGDSR